jgi:hypothetical protein
MPESAAGVWGTYTVQGCDACHRAEGRKRVGLVLPSNLARFDTHSFNHPANSQARARGEWGSQETGPKFIPADELLPIAMRLRDWLRKDLHIQFQKHNPGGESMEVLRAASFLDPRRKMLASLPEEERSATALWVQKTILKQAEKDPAFIAERETKRLEGAAAAAANEAREAEGEADLDEMPFVAVAKVPACVGKHMKVPELRRQCELRGMDASRLEAVLVARLGDYNPDVALASAKKAAAAKKEDACRAAAEMRAKQPGGDDERPFCAADLRALGEDISGIPAQSQFLSLHRTIKRQLEAYEAEAPIEPQNSPLALWKRNESRFPHISALAQRMLSIPGGAAELERMFSHAGRAVGPQRPRLDPKSATEVMFCHENICRGVF